MVRFLVLYGRPDDPRRSTAITAMFTSRWPRSFPAFAGTRSAVKHAGSRRRAYYLVAELDWDDMPALQRAFQSPEGHATASDVANLADGGVHSMILDLEEV
jgi:uncharacterized protein (TIGR02118 family)